MGPEKCIIYAAYMMCLLIIMCVNVKHNTADYLCFHLLGFVELENLSLVSLGKSSESVQCVITGPCLCMRHRPSA